jgi:ZIP family zinc transporter
MLPLFAGLSAFISTLSGGLFAIRYRRYLNRILGFTAGVVMGVIAFDVLPEIFDILNQQAADATGAMIALLAGFFAFHISEKLISSHHAHEADAAHHTNPKVGVLSAAGLVGHSFLDGVGIGLAFQVNVEIGLAVTLAVIAHDFSDGLNTVSLMLAHGNELRRTILMLIAGAAAPILGVLSTKLVHLSEYQLTLYLGFFAGFLLYIAAACILPEAHRHYFSWKNFGLTLLGATFMFVVTRASF